MTTLILVRHAETVAHAENRYTGVREVELTRTGADQAMALRDWAMDAQLTAIWSSPLSRCQLTAAPTALATGLPVTIDDRLREVDFGLLDGMTASEAHALYPEMMEAFWQDPVANHFPGGEPPGDAVERAVSALREIAHATPDGRTLVVAHSTLIRLILCHVLGASLSAYRTNFPLLDNCALTTLRIKEDRLGLMGYNVPIANAYSTQQKVQR